MRSDKENKPEKSNRIITNQPGKSKKSLVKDTDADGSSPYVDLDKANFTDRKHGRTNDSLGPDHEPGTV